MNLTKMICKAAVLVLILSGAVMAEGDVEKKAAEEKQTRLLEQVWTQLETGDSFQTTEFIESQGSPLEVAGLYSNLLRGLYYKKKNVPRMILIGRAGIRYCLQHAQAAAKAESNSDDAKKLNGMAKTIAFNLSVNTWPAWEDEGIVVTRTDQIIGLDAARLNLRLARELNRSADKVANAFWLLGAHQLALQKFDTAAKHFEQAAQNSAEAKTPDAEQMARGYIAITRLAADKTDSADEKQLDESIEKLKTLGTEDAKFYADQLKSVNAFFMR